MAEAIGLKVDDPRFWDPAHLRDEVDRIFDICWSCRLCFKFCGSFPTLFELIDQRTERMRAEYLAAHPEIVAAADAKRREAAAEPAPAAEPEGEVGVTYGDELPTLYSHACDLTTAEVDRVVDLCFQCKLCYPNCPYTPPHDFALDFPRLLLRWKAQRTRREGVPLRARMLRDTATIGRLGARCCTNSSIVANCDAPASSTARRMRTDPSGSTTETSKPAVSRPPSIVAYVSMCRSPTCWPQPSSYYRCPRLGSGCSRIPAGGARGRSGWCPGSPR